MKMKRLVVFASYNQDEKILESTKYYLRSLKQECRTIIFVSDNYLDEFEKKKVEGVVDHFICKPHGEYDFGSYKRGFIYADQNGLLNEIDELIFCNDSCYGPVFPFDKIFNKMDKKDCDFWGMIDSIEGKRHICSFFYLFKRKVFINSEFRRFVLSWCRQENFWGYVLNYERKFTAVLEQAGFKYSVACQLSEEDRNFCHKRSGNGFLAIFPCLLHSYEMPLIKKKVFNGSYGNDLHQNPHEILNLIKYTNEELYYLIIKEINYKGMHDSMFGDRWEVPSEVMRDKRIVSFDIFDTLLIRPFKSPSDLFNYLELLYQIDGFAKARIKAESSARRVFANSADITLDQIYQCIVPEEFKIFKEKELEIEHQVLLPNPKILPLYFEAIKQNKTIIAISDMYLPEVFLHNLLKEKGFDKISRVFVSGEEKVCKYDGRLFKKVLQILQIRSDEILHIGDNLVSDKEAATSIGIKALHISSVLDDLIYNPGHNFCSKYSQKENKINSSILVGMFAYNKSKNKNVNSYYDLGYYLGGPFAIAYTNYIHKVSVENSIDELLFISRDGYTLRNIYNKVIESPIKNHYIYASRELILRCNNFKESDPEYYEKSKQIFISQNENQWDEYLYQQWIDKNYSDYMEWFVRSGVNGSNIASVDLTTAKFTAGSFLKKILGEKFNFSFCSCCLLKENKFKHYAFTNKDFKQSEYVVLKLIEELFSAPQTTCLKFTNGNPIFKTPSLIESIKIDNYKHIEQGINDFADDYVLFFGKELCCFNFSDFENLLNVYLTNLTFEDESTLKSIYHAGDVYNENYESLYDGVKEYLIVADENNHNSCYSIKNENALCTLSEGRKIYYKRINTLKYIKYRVLGLLLRNKKLHYKSKIKDLYFNKNDDVLVYNPLECLYFRIMSKFSNKTIYREKYRKIKEVRRVIRYLEKTNK